MSDGDRATAPTPDADNEIGVLFSCSIDTTADGVGRRDSDEISALVQSFRNVTTIAIKAPAFAGGELDRSRSADRARTPARAPYRYNVNGRASDGRVQ